MIRVTIYNDSEKNPKGFRLEGHAGYAEHGHDIVCAAVSALAVNAVNSIETFAEDSFQGESDDTKGMMEFEFTGQVSAESRVLLKSLILGLENIRDEYGTEFIKILFREV